MIREATEHENYSAEKTFVSEELGKVHGFICLTRIEGKTGTECWVHELEASGMEAVKLMARARTQAKEWGFKDYWANVSNPDLAKTLVGGGWHIEQVILKGRTK